MNSEQVQEKVNELGKKMFGFLMQPCGSDRLDFHTVGCSRVADALAEAIRVGYQMAKEESHQGVNRTVVRFSTNIDCCKKFMGNISGLPITAINPSIGDRVRIYHDSSLDVWLKVVGRNWTMTNGSDPVLNCELHLQDGWTIPMLEKVWRS